jgi:peptide/nickel transport system permease protein
MVVSGMVQPQGALSSPVSDDVVLANGSPDAALVLSGRRARIPASGYIGTGIILLLVLGAAIGPLVEPLSPTHQDFHSLLQAPGASHPLGTDQLGRDVLSRLLSGARISLLLGVTVVVCSAVIGAVVGLVAGFAGGRVESALMRLADLFLAFPKLILAIAVSAALGPSLKNLLIAVSLTWWPEYARLARSVVLVLKHAEYVDAARVLGVSNRSILVRHMLPAVLPQVIVKGTMDVGFSIVYIAGLSFIGLGIQPPTAEWGLMVADGREYIQNAWWISTFPGIAILLAGLAFNLTGEAVRDVLDPRRAGH